MKEKYKAGITLSAVVGVTVLVTLSVVQAYGSDPRYIYMEVFDELYPEPYAYGDMDILEIDTEYPYEDVVEGDIVRYLQCHGNCTHFGYNAGRVTVVNEVLLVVQPINPELNVKAFIFPNTYAGIIHQRIECIADFTKYSNSTLSTITGSTVLFEFDSGIRYSDVGKWIYIESANRYCNMDYVHIDTQRNILEYFGGD